MTDAVITPPRDLLVALEPAAERLVNRHLGMTREWFPHDYIPYSLGRDYDKEPFLIHGTGTYGSDGCIVIERVNRKVLLDAVEAAGGAVLLVSNALQPGDLIDTSQRAERTA